MTDRRPNWHDDVFFGLHYDLHANADDTELGREISYDHIRERLERVRPDWVHCDCKGHAGYTSWPTTVGSTSPGMLVDQLRVYRDVTRDMGIKLNMHYSGVWDTRAVELHPDWGRVDADGKTDPDITCRMSGYDDELMIPQMLELIDTYDVDGFWVDGENWASKPCWCERCRAEYIRRTGDDAPRSAEDAAWASWLQFHRDLFVEHVRHYTDAVHAHKPTCTVVSNWMYTARQPEAISAPIDYISGDYDWNFGANRAAIEGRVIDSRDRSWDLMAWGFTKTNQMNVPPHWVMKPALHLQQELAEVVALGGAIMIYNTPQRTGWLTGWHQDTMAAAAAFCRERQDACWQSRPVPEAAVLHLTDHYYATNDLLYNYGPGGHPVEGALQVLLETHRSTDVLTRDAALRRMDDYKLIVVPEQTHLSDEIAARLQTAAERGAFVIMSGAHLAHDRAELVGATPTGDVPADDVIGGFTFLETRGHAVPVTGPWQPVAATDNAEVWTYRLKHHDPEKDRTDQAIVTYRPVGQGGIIAIHGPIFYDYFRGHYPLLRQFIGDLVARLPIAWTAIVEASPRLELILREKDGSTVVNLVNRGAAETLSPQRVLVDELLPVHDVRVRLRRDHAPAKVSIVPSSDSFDWSYDGTCVELQIPSVAIHTAIVVE